MNEQEHLNTLSEIKQLMERSSRFLSLSGLSSVCIGVYALLGAFAGWWYLSTHSIDLNSFYKPIYDSYGNQSLDHIAFLMTDALLVLMLSLISSFVLTKRLASKQGLSSWDQPARRMLLDLLIPLLTGGLYCLILLKQQRIEWIASAMLLFYGLSLINASHHTRNEIRQLGLLEITLGLFAALFPGHGISFWVVGFGVLHIIYGIRLYYTYER